MEQERVHAKHWAVYSVDDGEAHVASIDEEHELHVACACNPRIEVGEDYFLVIHSEWDQ